MGLRVVVVAAFLAMAAVPAYLAYEAGLFPGPTQASADVSPGGAESRGASLPWPDEALGLAAPDTRVLWEQRDPSAVVAGLWPYDVRTGRIRWTFRTIPRPGEAGQETWPKDAWKTAGGANAWSGISVDPARGLVFVPTGSPAFDFWGGDRHVHS